MRFCLLIFDFMKLSFRVSFIVVLFLVSFAYIFPWNSYGIAMPFSTDSSYKLGLDLHGGVELDYKVDFE